MEETTLPFEYERGVLTTLGTSVLWSMIIFDRKLESLLQKNFNVQLTKGKNGS